MKMEIKPIHIIAFTTGGIVSEERRCQLDVNGIRMHGTLDDLVRELTDPRPFADVQKSRVWGEAQIYGLPTGAYYFSYDGDYVSFEFSDEERRLLIADLKTCPKITVEINDHNYTPGLPTTLVDPELKVIADRQMVINGVSMPIRGADYFHKVLSTVLALEPDDDGWEDGWGHCDRVDSGVFVQIGNIEFVLSCWDTERLIDLLQDVSIDSLCDKLFTDGLE